MMALVVALGALGVGYAMWSDTVTIDGTVETGSVDLEIVGVSETYVYKDLVTKEMVCLPAPSDNPDYLLVASATTTAVGGPEPVDEAVTMTFDNIFPTDMAVCPIVADVMFHYAGSIPVHIWYDEVIDPSIAPYVVQRWTLNGVPIDPSQEVIQLHYCDQLYLEVFLDGAMLQADGVAAQNLSGSFTKTIVAHQWNEAMP
jgi:predicted ribosomally synthesized peptide with SipW-like signal peptide